ncbi:UNVERIFIED_CONTAM: hypothetical protein Sradi_4512900 [Sesamum radiatum]|uniref:Uncharacterized protein n=1 Tax=Sesamum radiatum TaxID=300843 RepID=A0AAW2N959_SESRA
MSEYAFADLNNLEHCAKYLNNTLVTFGFPASLDLFSNDPERLNQVLMEKKKESRSGMEIMNLLQKEGRQRGTWNAKKTDNDFYKKIASIMSKHLAKSERPRRLSGHLNSERDSLLSSPSEFAGVKLQIVENLYTDN